MIDLCNLMVKKPIAPLPADCYNKDGILGLASINDTQTARINPTDSTSASTKTILSPHDARQQAKSPLPVLSESIVARTKERAHGQIIF